MALLKAGTGIGTTSPQSDLHVEGTMTVAGVSTFNNIIESNNNLNSSCKFKNEIK